METIDPKYGLKLEVLKEMRDDVKKINDSRYAFLCGIIEELENGKDIGEIVKYYEYIISLLKTAKIYM